MNGNFKCEKWFDWVIKPFSFGKHSTTYARSRGSLNNKSNPDVRIEKTETLVKQNFKEVREIHGHPRLNLHVKVNYWYIFLWFLLMIFVAYSSSSWLNRPCLVLNSSNNGNEIATGFRGTRPSRSDRFSAKILRWFSRNWKGFQKVFCYWLKMRSICPIVPTHCFPEQ